MILIFQLRSDHQPVKPFISSKFNILEISLSFFHKTIKCSIFFAPSGKIYFTDFITSSLWLGSMVLPGLITRNVSSSQSPFIIFRKILVLPDNSS